MKILSIETSCDETAVSIVEAEGGTNSPFFKVLGSVVHSQAPLHAEWQGVVPNLAKREHSRNLVPVLRQALAESNLLKSEVRPRTTKGLDEKVGKLLEREPNLLEPFLDLINTTGTPDIDIIAVTYGPGLEPALWTGVNFAKALGVAWDKPIVPINHMEGHLLSVLIGQNEKGAKIEAVKLEYPAIGLLISGGHTELVLIKENLKYQVVGHTRDDAVGEAFDKVARVLGLPYPGGPEVSRLADKYEAEHKDKKREISLPRPMINSGDLDFSFSGLKTAVLYKARDIGELSERQKTEIAYEFEQAVVDVLVAKTRLAIEQCSSEERIRTLIIGGGVIANKKIRSAFGKMAKDEDVALYIPHSSLATDNATMIAIAGYFRWLDCPTRSEDFKATGNLELK